MTLRWGFLGNDGQCPIASTPTNWPKRWITLNAKSSLEQFADQCGVNVLPPASPNEVKTPEQWKDIWGNPLPNPFATNDLKGQSLVQQRDPELAKWLKAFATDPYGAKTAWADAETKLLKAKALTYDGDTHAINPYVTNANETEKATFVRNADPATVERCKWEAKPVTFPHAKDFDLTQQSKIASVPRLSALWNAMTTAESEYVAAETVAAGRLTLTRCPTRRFQRRT